MATTKLDAAVKGTASAQKEKVAAATSQTSGVTSISTPSDPLSALPSSPPQIYLNLLILEASLRSQYLQLRVRRRQYNFFLCLLLVWTVYFTYALFFATREDGAVGGSVYWVVEMGEKVAFMGGIVTGILIWGTGQWERGYRWPRRWIGITNRGLRGFNLKIVVVRKGMWEEWLDLLRFYLNGSLWRGAEHSNYRFIDQSLQGEKSKRRTPYGLSNIREESKSDYDGYQEDLSKGGDTISLLLLPKPFSASFRENWDSYRTEYWDKENARRSELLQKVKAHDKAVLKKARQELTWSQYFFWWKRALKRELSTTSTSQHNATSSLKSQEKRLRSGSAASLGRSGSHSRTSSRVSTPVLEAADVHTKHSRRSSTASNTSAIPERRKKRPTSLIAQSSSTSSVSGHAAMSAPHDRSHTLFPPGSGMEKDESSPPETPMSEVEALGSPLLPQTSKPESVST